MCQQSVPQVTAADAFELVGKRFEFADGDVVGLVESEQAKKTNLIRIYALTQVDVHPPSRWGGKRRGVVFVSRPPNKRKGVVIIGDKDGVSVRRAFRIEDVACALINEDPKTGKSQFMLVMHESSREPAILCDDLQSDGFPVLRAINFLKVKQDVGKLLIYDLRHVGLDLRRNALLQKPSGYQSPSEKL
eukprot:gene1336-2068_t